MPPLAHTLYREDVKFSEQLQDRLREHSRATLGRASLMFRGVAAELRSFSAVMALLPSSTLAHGMER